MLKCPICNCGIIDFNKTKYVCSNDKCDFLCKKEDFERKCKEECNKKSVWNLQLANELNWHTRAFEEYPFVIAHEYKRIQDLLLEGCPYGALFQIKDLLEVLVKFYTLVGASIIYHKDEKSSEDNYILKCLVDKFLSLGDWLSIANILKDSKTISEHKSLHELLQSISKTYEEYQITNWRNREIGHGALKFKDDEGFIKDLTDKLYMIRILFNSNHINLSETKLYYIEQSNDESSIVQLTGAILNDTLEGLPHELHITMGALEICMYPFFKLDKRGLYFFDSYLGNKSKTDILNYPEGHKLTKTQKEFGAFHSLYSQLVGKNENVQEGKKTLDSQTYNEIQNRMIEAVSEVQDYMEPMYLMDHIKKFLFEEEHKKGILFLQMESGMGKTTLCKALDEQSCVGRTFLHGFSTRAVYLNDKYLNTGDKLLSTVESKLKENKKKELTIEGIISHESDKKKRIANLLNLYIKPYRDFFKTQKLLLIIDGLDEVAKSEGNSIFDYFPCTEDLVDNIFILLTCRIDDEISTYTKNGLSTLKADKTCIVKNEEGENIQLLRRFIKDRITQDEESIRIILERSANRFIYVKLSEILLQLDDKKVDGLPDYSSMFETYLNKLKKLYGEKESKRILDILEVLVTSYEPLTFREISYLIDEEHPSYKLVACMEDIKHLLKADRVIGRDTVYSVVHQTFRKSFEKIYYERINLRIMKFINQFENIIYDIENGINNIKDPFKGTFNNGWDIKKNLYNYYNNYTNDGEVYLITYINQYIEEYTSEREIDYKYINAFKANMLKRLKRPPIVNFLYSKYCGERIVYLLGQLIHVQENSNKRIYDLIDLYYERGNASLSLNNMSDALRDANCCVSTCLKLVEKNENRSNTFILAVALGNRGNTLRRLNRLNEALEDVNNQIAILEKIGDKCARYEIVLANAYLNRSNAFRRTNNYLHSKQDADMCLRMLKKIYENGKLSDKNDLAKAYMMRGNAFLCLNRLNDALNDQNESIAIREELDRKNELHDRNNLASTYQHRAKVYYKMKHYQEAYEDCNKSAEILRLQDQKGLLHDKNMIASVYMSKGDALVRLNYCNKALEDYNECIEILESLRQMKKIYDEKSLRMAYKKRKLIIDYLKK